MKRIALLLVTLVPLGAACKTNDSAPQPQPTPTEPAPAARTHPRTAPSLAVPEPLAEGSNRPALPDEVRHHGDRMARMDTDGDGKISPEEREAAMKQRAATMRARLDTNGDGKLTPDELANAKGRMKFDDPAALDTNKDGDISADELEAGMVARREQMRVQRLQQQKGSAAATGPQ